MSPSEGAPSSEPSPDEDSLLTFRVEGSSMWPTIAHGATLTVAPRARCQALGLQWPPAVGELVVARHPFRRGLSIVKRVVAYRGERLVLRGDSVIESEDSGAFGGIAPQALVGLVIAIDSAVDVTRA